MATRPGAAGRAPVPDSGFPLIFWGLAMIRLRRSLRRSLAMALGIVLAVALPVSMTLVQAVAADVGVQGTVEQSGSDGRMMITENTVNSAPVFADAVRSVRQRVHGTAGGLFEPGASFLATTFLNADTLNGQLVGSTFQQAATTLDSYPDLAAHVTAVSGRLPSGSAAGDPEAAVTAQAAQTFGLHAGDRLCLVANQGGSFCARLVGVLRPRADSTAWWGPQTPDSAVLVDQATYFRLLPGLQAQSFAHVTFSPDATAFGQTSLDTALDRLNQLRTHYGVFEQDAALSTGLDTRLAAYQARVQVAQFALLLVVAEILLVAFLYLSFTAGHLLDQQREELGVWRSRGWRRRGVWAVLTVEFAVVACLSLPVGVAVGLGGAAAVLRLVYGAVPVQLALAAAASMWQPALVAVGLVLGVLAWRAAGASRQQLLDARRMASRPELRPWWQWRYLDLGLGVLGVLLLIRTPLIGEGENGLDPSTLALPGLGLVALALAALRLLPAAAWVVGRGKRGVALALATWQLGRQPVQHSLLALLLLVTIALGVFAGTYVSTQQRNTSDRAAYTSGADLRAQFGGDTNVPPIQQSLARLQGVSAATAVYRGSGQLGNLATSQPAVLGVDPYGFNRVAWSRPGLDDPSLSSKIDQLLAHGGAGQQLPGRPERLGIWAYSSGIDGTLTVTVVDSSGRSGELSLGRLDYSGWRHLDAPVEPAMRHLGFPLFVQELDVRGASNGRRLTGTVGLRDLGVTQPGAEGPQPVVSFASTQGTGWWASAGTGLSLGALKASSAVPFGGQPSTVLDADLSAGEMVIRPVPTGAVPALVSSGTLRHTLISTGASFPLKLGAAQVPVVVVGQVDYVPTLYPGQQDFLVLDLQPLLAQLGYQGEPHAWPNELWANVSPWGDAADRTALRRAPGVSQVLDRRDLEQAAARDPIGVQLEATLLMGFATALVLAVAAFAVHFLSSVAGRRGEYAILEANGLTARTVGRSLGAEQGVLLAFGLIAGLGLGLLVAWIVLPTLRLSTDPTSAVPPTVVTVNWPLVGAALGGVAVLSIAAGLAVNRTGRHFRLVEELRAL